MGDRPSSRMAGVHVVATPASWAGLVTSILWAAKAHRSILSSFGVLVVLGWLLCRWWLRRGRLHGLVAWRLRHARLSERLRETYMIPQTGMDLRIGLDIGGSLAKLVFIEQEGVSSPFQQFMVASTKYGNTGVRDEALAVRLPDFGGRMHFIHFDTTHVEGAVQMMQAHGLDSGFTTLYATGGGAHKFKDVIQKSLDCELVACSELGTVVLGICFMTLVEDECYTFERVPDPSLVPDPTAEAEVTRRPVVLPPHPEAKPQTSSERAAERGVRRVQRDLSSVDFFPFLLCNVGTGCSILKVTSETQYERVSGTALGGGTFLGLCRLLTKVHTFREAMEMAEGGDARNVDMLVRDIYGEGEDRSGLKLPGDLVASFFARNIQQGDETPTADDHDVCKALVVMIAQNLAQIAHLNAQVHGLRRVFFTGNFLRGNELAMRTIVYTMQRMPRVAVHGEPSRKRDLLRPVGSEPTEAVFFRHEGYFGAIGAYLEQCRDRGRASSDGDVSE